MFPVLREYKKQFIVVGIIIIIIILIIYNNKCSLARVTFSE